MWIAYFNSHFEHSLGALVYSDEKVACIVITQSIKMFTLKKEILEVFFWMKKKDYSKFFFVLSVLANIKMSADLPRNFLKMVLKSP